MRKKDKINLWIGVITLLVIIGLLVIPKLNLISVSPYCKTLPNNAVNTVHLYEDENDCDHWYIEIKSVLKNCFCIGGERICEGDSDYISVLNGCSGALPPGCPTCPLYSYTPIADYGGLIDDLECTKDLIKQCTDGSEIIEKICIEGMYVNTNNTCNILECTLDSECNDNFKCINNECVKKDSNNLEIIFIIVGIIILIVLIIERRKIQKWLKKILKN